MTPRRLGLLLGLAAFAAAGAREVRAEGMMYQESQAVYQSEGSNPIPFNVSCSSSAWTLVIASDTISRSTFMENVPSNTSTVCLSPVAASSATCVAVTPGPQLPVNSALTDYSRASWWCSSSTGTATNVISGYRTRDKRDFGWIGASGLQ